MSCETITNAREDTLNKSLLDQPISRVSLPFQPDEHWRIAVKMIDPRGNVLLTGVAWANERQLSIATRTMNCQRRWRLPSRSAS